MQLSKWWGEPGIWEPLWDAPNYFGNWQQYPFGDEANVWLVPTPKATRWKKWETYEAFGKDEGWPKPDIEQVDDPT